MTMDSLGVIRRGWQEVATTVAPHVPALADLLERRLGEAQRLHTLDEASLLRIVDAATQLAADSGAVEIAPTLSKRLRRHVYEYLLSLDAAGDSASEPESAEIAAADDGEPLIGTDEVALLRSTKQLLEGAAAAWAGAQPLNGADATADDSTARPLLPQFGFHIGDPDDMLATSPPAPERDGNGTHAVFDPLDLQPPVPLAVPRRTAFGDPSTWPKPVVPQLRGVPGNGAGPTPHAAAEDSRAPSGAAPVHPPAPSTEAPAQPGAAERNGGSPSRLQPPLSIPSSETESVAPNPRDSDAETDAAAAGPMPLPDGRSEPSPAPTPAAPTAAVPSVPALPSPTRASEVQTAAVPPGPSLELLAFSGVGSESPPGEPVSEEDVAALRTAVEERLRKKRCDEVASLLQRTAQDLGGQAVASIALDAGDRCRALGKPNAALNCYLAASRADPVFEPPLARLADICIDDQDIDLAVSYLERIARLTRLRGDQRGALRIYRKIATIAPYRDDVLETLMRAAESGRID